MHAFSHTRSQHLARNVIAVGLAASMVAGPAVPAVTALAESADAPAAIETQARIFSDVDYGAWYAPSVTFCAERGIMSGYGGSTRFGVGDPLKTEELAAILWNIAEPGHGRGEVVNTTGKVDVMSNQWYTGACDWAKANGVINGYGGTDRFGVGDHITAERLATILYNFTGQTSMSTTELSSFTDQADVSSWARAACAWAKRAGLVNGYPDGTFRPKEEIKRERVAAILKNAVDHGVIRLSSPAKDDPAPTPSANTYTIRFDGNGATSGSMADITVGVGKSITLSRNGFRRTGYRFLGWSTDRTAVRVTHTDMLSIRDLAKAGDTITLYAVWEPII